MALQRVETLFQPIKIPRRAFPQAEQILEPSPPRQLKFGGNAVETLVHAVQTILGKEQAIIDASSPSFSNSLAISPFRRTTTIKVIVRASRFHVKRCRNSQQRPDRPAGPLLGFVPRVSARRHPEEHGSPAICASGPLPSVQTKKSPPSGVCRACTTDNRGCRRASCQADAHDSRDPGRHEQIDTEMVAIAGARIRLPWAEESCEEARSLVHAHLRNKKITAALGIGPRRRALPRARHLRQAERPHAAHHAHRTAGLPSSTPGPRGIRSLSDR